MTFRVVRAQRAQTELARFAEYAADYTDDWAREQFTRLERVFSRDLAEAPQQWSYFYLTGAPYRAYLFRVGRRTQFWIVYTIDQDANTVNILRFWTASGNSETFAIRSALSSIAG